MTNLTNQQNPEWALFLPALSSFYIAGLGKQRKGENYFDQLRIPQQIQDLEVLNFLNSKKALFPYKWALYSAGHADLTGYATNSSESIVVDREPGTFILADSGGFQILKCQWPADWKNPNCSRAMKKRKEVLNWMEANADYGMCLDIPSQSQTTYDVIDPKTGKSAHGIKTIDDAIAATHINNEYFINNRNGNCKFLNVLQGRNHNDAKKWYGEMKKYCDPKVYPERHFNGWAFGGQTKTDIELFLTMLVTIIEDDLLQPGVHDWIHCLGTSILEWAVLFTDVQKAVRKYHNPNLTISFDCASPFFSAAKGLAYFNTSIEHNKKWSYSMEKTAEDKKYATDTRKFSDAVLADGIHKKFVDSPVTDRMVLKDLCYRGQGFIGNHGKETKTSWDTLSYTLIQSHNVYQHMWAVQEANRKYESGTIPSMLMHVKYDTVLFSNVVEEIFSEHNYQKRLEIIKKYKFFWKQFKSGSQGISGEKTVNSTSSYIEHFEGGEEIFTVKKAKSNKKKTNFTNMFEQLFEVEDNNNSTDEEMQDSDDEMMKALKETQ
jgi:hypothetical protein